MISVHKLFKTGNQELQSQQIVFARSATEKFKIVKSAICILTYQTHLSDGCDLLYISIQWPSQCIITEVFLFPGFLSY